LPASAQAPMGCEQHLAVVHRETSDVVQALLASLKGGVSKADATKLRGEIAEAQQALANLDGELRAQLADTS
ncbi:hypothetical protein, partial [Bradyrhizobium sp.]|uniref:hypothetical protein n=1 Tax=Bradyrhizobium sp. TaxID=376 RepID=UPI0025C5F51A